MKRFAVREIALLCAPLAVVGIAALVSRLLHPPKDPNAVISLAVKQNSIQPFQYQPFFSRLDFSWEAKASGGPSYDYRLRFRQEIVAIGKSGEVVLLREPSAASTREESSGSYSRTPNDGVVMWRMVSIDGTKIPIEAQRLEWRGEVVAAPTAGGETVAPETATTLAGLATIKGAARVNKIIRLPFDAAKNAISRCQIEPVNATNAAQGIDTCLTVETRHQNRAVCRRLVTFDGQTRRVLWDDAPKGVNKLWRGEESSMGSGLTSSTLMFKLREVPRAWGEITFLYDVVFPAVAPPPNTPPRAMNGGTRVDLKAIEALERAGGLRFSRRVVVRRAGETIEAAKYKKTPNLQLVSVKTAKIGGATQIVATLRYFGPRADPEVEVIDSSVLFDDKGKSLDIIHSFGVSRGKTSREWSATIGLKPHKPNIACRFKVEIADGDAVPLKVNQPLLLP